MNTPVYDFVKEYCEKENVRLHMPGHKGRGFFFCDKYDITEIDGADVLYHETGILKESEENASRLFSSAKTLYSAEGSSLCIRAILMLLKQEAARRGERPLIAAGRNAHKVFNTAAALIGIDIEWIYPENINSLVSADISPSYLREFLENCSILPQAVYITSPDYLGNIADIKGLSQVCREKGVLLAVDNAHGAYLHFLPESMHPIQLGADICCDSAHKTLPVITGGAYLHLSENAPATLFENAENAMSLFSTTSPSYLILASLDFCNKYLAEGFRKELELFTEKLGEIKKELVEAGFCFMGNEPLKLTVSTKKYGYTGYEFSDILREKGIECEFFDPDFIVMMFTPFITDEELLFIKKTLLEIPKRSPVTESIPSLPKPSAGMNPSEVLFLPDVAVNVREATGRILSSPSVMCPPAVPVAVCGERLTREAIECFEYYGIEKVRVIKE